MLKEILFETNSNVYIDLGRRFYHSYFDEINADYLKNENIYKGIITRRFACGDFAMDPFDALYKHFNEGEEIYIITKDKVSIGREIKIDDTFDVDEERDKFVPCLWVKIVDEISKDEIPNKKVNYIKK